MQYDWGSRQADTFCTTNVGQAHHGHASACLQWPEEADSLRPALLPQPDVCGSPEAHKCDVLIRTRAPAMSLKSRISIELGGPGRVHIHTCPAPDRDAGRLTSQTLSTDMVLRHVHGGEIRTSAGTFQMQQEVRLRASASKRSDNVQHAIAAVTR
jgi:hypothetical protein